MSTNSKKQKTPTTEVGDVLVSGWGTDIEPSSSVTTGYIRLQGEQEEVEKTIRAWIETLRKPCDPPPEPETRFAKRENGEVIEVRKCTDCPGGCNYWYVGDLPGIWVHRSRLEFVDLDAECPFEPGDRVRVTHGDAEGQALYDTGQRFTNSVCLEVGDEFEIREVQTNGNLWACKEGAVYHAFCELVETKKQKTPTFEVGDRVRLVAPVRASWGMRPSHYAGREGEVTEPEDYEGDITVVLDSGRETFVLAESLELVEDDETPTTEVGTITVRLEVKGLDEACEKAKELRRIIEQIKR